MKLRSTLLVVLFFLSASPAFSQGCAMCRNAVAATTKEGQKAIGKGVAVLIIPPVGFMTVGFGLALRYGRKRDLENI
jgi:hypothetical protein